MRPACCGLLGWVLLAALPLSAHADEDAAELARKARLILSQNCYRCHGENGANDGGFNYALNREQLIARKKLVPGDAQKSKLLKRVRAGDMPPEDEQPRPSPEDVEVLSKWIDAGAPDFDPPAPKRQIIPFGDVYRLMRSDLGKFNDRDRRYQRYFTLTHLHNAGLSADEMQSYRVGLSKLVNSLSWERRIVAPKSIDTDGTLLRIDLRDYRWDYGVWDAVAAAHPYPYTPTGNDARACYAATGCKQPAVRGDWFVHAASRPPLYHDILKLPKTERELEKQLGIDTAHDVERGRVSRSGFNGSGVSQNNRLIERHDSPYGAYWKSYDFASNVGKQNLFERPLGPGTGAYDFQHDGGEIIFNLPNGLQAYLLADAKGNRIDKGPPNIVSDPKQKDRAVVNGVSCMSCHARGMIEKADQVREHVRKNARAFGRSELEAVAALYPSADRFAAQMREDAERFAAAVEKTGAKVSATEPVLALAQRFEAELDLSLAAAEAGVSPAEFASGLDRSPRLARVFGPLRVAGGTVQRQAYAAEFHEVLRTFHAGAFPADLPEGPGEAPTNGKTSPIVLAQIPAGRFVMGSPRTEAGRRDDETPFEVTISRPFLMSTHEITQAQYAAVMGKNPAHFTSANGGGPNHPVEQVSWEDAMEFCRRLSARPEERRAGREWRLPTQAEWEYACRGGRSGRVFCFGDALSSEQANFDGAAPYGGASRGPCLSRTAPVGSYKPNGFGLYDMHGNVWEWCLDWYDVDYAKHAAPRDPFGPPQGEIKVVRGGCWKDEGQHCRSAIRLFGKPTDRTSIIGFRVVCVPAR
jgi:formylglycine-generating enzyme required for sulfatase activity/mono/diheme cytochrome c family protein